MDGNNRKGAHMGQSWEDILEWFCRRRDDAYRTDPERDAARLDNVESAVQAILEKMRDAKL